MCSAMTNSKNATAGGTARPYSERRRVRAEHVLHRRAHLADRAAVLQRLADRRQQVLRAASRLAQLLKATLDEREVALGLEPREPIELFALGLRVDAEQIGHLDALFLVLVHADNDVLTDPVALLIAPRR